jgi:hypothetical protein
VRRKRDRQRHAPATNSTPQAAPNAAAVGDKGVTGRRDTPGGHKPGHPSRRRHAPTAPAAPRRRMEGLPDRPAGRRASGPRPAAAAGPLETTMTRQQLTCARVGAGLLVTTRRDPLCAELGFGDLPPDASFYDQRHDRAHCCFATNPSLARCGSRRRLKLGSCFDVGAVLTPGAEHTLSLFQGRCVARLREARRQTWCPPSSEV